MEFGKEMSGILTGIQSVVCGLLLIGIVLYLPVHAATTGENTGKFEESASDSKLYFGIAGRDITPDPGTYDWVTGRPYGEVHEQIYVRVAVLGDGEEMAVIISWDLVDAGESATFEVREAISTRLGIPSGNILVNATHNHSAPWSPVYSEDFRGDERDTWWAIRYMPNQNEEPHFRAWMGQLLEQTTAAAIEAVQSMQPASLWIGRVDIGKYLYNRRPISPESGIAENRYQESFNVRSEEWDPGILQGGSRFGPVDRTMTLLTFRDESDAVIGTMFHMACHAVSIYPYMEGISGDWPAEAVRRISQELGGQSLFLQGTAGDVTPWRRGPEAVREMGSGLAERAAAADRHSARLKPGSLSTSRAVTALPLTEVGKERTGLDVVEAEVQVIRYGTLALVTLPGEPLTDLGTAIRERSPFPQTLVLGYSNGNGVHYVGMPGEKAKEGYEMTSGTVGTDEAGLILVEIAIRQLKEMVETE